MTNIYRPYYNQLSMALEEIWNKYYLLVTFKKGKKVISKITRNINRKFLSVMTSVGHRFAELQLLDNKKNDWFK